MWGDFFTVHVWQLSAMAGLLICSAFFSGSETAMFNLSRRQLHRLAGSGRAGGIVASLRRRPHDLLHALLLGNLLVNVAYTAIAAMLVFRLGQSLLPRWAAAAGSLAAMVVLILTGEVAPKMLALPTVCSDQCSPEPSPLIARSTPAPPYDPPEKVQNRMSGTSSASTRPSPLSSVTFATTGCAMTWL